MPGFRGSNSAGSEKDSTEMLFLLWECITALEMQNKVFYDYDQVSAAKSSGSSSC